MFADDLPGNEQAQAGALGQPFLTSQAHELFKDLGELRIGKGFAFIPDLEPQVRGCRGEDVDHHGRACFFQRSLAGFDGVRESSGG